MHPLTLLLFVALLSLGLPPAGDAANHSEASQAQTKQPYQHILPLKLTTELHLPIVTKEQPTILPSKPEKAKATPKKSANDATRPTSAAQNQAPLMATSEADLLRHAEQQWQLGKHDKARMLYNAFLKRFPDYPHNHLVMVRVADALQRKQQIRAALKYYGEIIKTYPGTQGALISHLRMAELGMQSPGLLRRSDETHFEAYHQPVKGLRKLIQHSPTNQLADIARFKIAAYKLQAGELNSALTLLRNLAKKRLADHLIPLVQDKLGQALQQQLAALQERQVYTEVLQTFYLYRPLLMVHNIINPQIILPVAVSYARLGLVAEAESLLQWLLTVNPSKIPTALNGSDQQNALFLVEKKRQHPKAMSKTETAALRTKILFLLGEWTLRNHQPDKAIAYLRQLDPSTVEMQQRVHLYALLAASYHAQADLDNRNRIVQECTSLLNSKPDNSWPESELCLRHAGKMLFNSGQYQASLEMYQKLMQLFPESKHREQTVFHMALIHQELGQDKQITENFELLRDTASNSLWQKVAIDSLDHLAWQKRLHEHLSALQNNTMQ